MGDGYFTSDSKGETKITTISPYYGSAISIDKNKLTITPPKDAPEGATDIVVYAFADKASAQYTHTFNQWDVDAKELVKSSTVFAANISKTVNEYTISGTITTTTETGVPGGFTVSYDTEPAVTTTSNEDGTYELTVPYNETGATITYSKTGYVSKTTDDPVVVVQPVDDQDIEVEPIKYKIQFNANGANVVTKMDEQIFGYDVEDKLNSCVFTHTSKEFVN